MSDDPRHVSESLDAEALAAMQERTERLAEKARERSIDAPAPVSIQARREAAWSALIPPRFAGARLDQLDPLTAEAVTRWVDAPEPVNLVLSGPAGTGKTHAGVAALRVAWERRATVAYANVADLLAAMRPSGEHDAFAKAVGVGVLLLDDLGALRDTDWTDETLYRLLDHRWREFRPVVATTNLTLETLAVTVGDRLYERLCLSDAVLFALKGGSRRRG